MKVEILTSKPLPKRKFPEFKKESERKWSAHMPKRDAKRCVKKAKRYHLNARAFEEKYDRSPKYRYEFIKANPPVDGMYRCVYCGRLVKKDDMEVDHVLPVRKAKESKRVQRRLKNGVNQISNLVPSCHRCNQKKSDSMSLRWRIKASLGRHNVYWAVRYLLLLVVVTVLIGFIGTRDDSFYKQVEQMFLWFSDSLSFCVRWFYEKIYAIFVNRAIIYRAGLWI